MASFNESIEVKVPVREAFVLFSDFERFPVFMEGVEEVRRTGRDTLHWKAEIGGVTQEWNARITEELIDERIAWASTSGAKNDGVVTFDKTDENTSRINLSIEYEPEGVVENIGAWLGLVNGRIRGDLQRFKDLAEDVTKPPSGEHAYGAPEAGTEGNWPGAEREVNRS